jgi:hypothetical protein
MTRHQSPGPVPCRTLTPPMWAVRRWAVRRMRTPPTWPRPRPWPVLVKPPGPRACDRAAGSRAKDEFQDKGAIAQQAQQALVATRRCSAIR